MRLRHFFSGLLIFFIIHISTCQRTRGRNRLNQPLPGVTRTMPRMLGTQKALIASLLENYDVNESPHFDLGRRTEVKIQLYINSFGSLNAANMDYSIDTFLRQTWNDPRMRYSGGKKSITIREKKILDQIWLPDTFFENVKEAAIHTVTMPNILFRVDRNGDILYSMRVQLRLTCNMDYSFFPHDSQVCGILIQSYANTDDVIKYYWVKEKPIEVTKGLSISQFDLLANHTLEKTYNYETGNFSGLHVMFSLRRQNGYHILQTYIPTVLIVSISWVSFWLDPNAVPGRVSLGVTTLLTLTTLAAGIRQQLPPVSYVKAIDVWIGICMIMVFGALLEFTFANWLANRKIAPGHTPVAIPRCLMCLSYRGDEAKAGSASPEPKPAMVTYLAHARALDRICRCMFPGSFFLFNIVYWPYYISHQYSDPFLYLE